MAVIGLVVEKEFPMTEPEIDMLLPASPRADVMDVFAFCVVAKPMLRTTKAKAAATITKAIKTIADSIPMTPLWACLCPFRKSFIRFVMKYFKYFLESMSYMIGLILGLNMKSKNTTSYLEKGIKNCLDSKDILLYL